MSTFNDELISAFAVAYPPGLRVIGCSCDECVELEKDFAEREWASLADNVIERHYDRLSLLTPEAFRYFIPAFLRSALSEPTSNVGEFVLYSLAPSGVEASVISGFTTQQRSAVVKFLDLMVSLHPGLQDNVYDKTRTRWGDHY